MLAVADLLGERNHLRMLGDDLPSPFGSVCAFNSSFARFVTASSVSSSRMRLRAAVSSPDSVPRRLAEVWETTHVGDPNDNHLARRRWPYGMSAPSTGTRAVSSCRP